MTDISWGQEQERNLLMDRDAVTDEPLYHLPFGVSMMLGSLCRLLLSAFCSEHWLTVSREAEGSETDTEMEYELDITLSPLCYSLEGRSLKKT